MKTKPEHSNPHGKAKVYFTAHPDDFPIWFERITNDILRYCPSTVYFDPDPDHPEDLDNYVFDLSLMNLIVIPITENFLKGDCLAFSTVFRMIQVKNIPFLPVLTDLSLTEEFNEKCGTVQAICPISSDVTEIPYETKLRKFLESAFLDDKLQKEVSALFEHQIFLSYRKKDRQKAQQLIRVIHEDEQLYTIAIWYDEFLKPGENFDLSIQNSLQESDLFALAVTNNMVYEPNYVRQIEYPLAVKLQKKVLPVLMENETVNRKALEAVFPGVHTVYPIHSNDLRNQLFELKKNYTPFTPKNCYLIGLAYVYGLDVEIDYEKGIRLIRKAADQNYFPAVQELVKIYRDGIGVRTDFDQAALWAKAAAQLQPGIETCETAGDILAQNNQMEEAIFFYTQGKEIADQNLLERIPSLNEDTNLQDTLYYIRAKSVFYQKIGEQYIYLNQLEQARDSLEDGIRLNRQMIQADNHPVYQVDLGFFLINLGRLERREQHLIQAESFYRRARDIFESLVLQDESSLHIRTLVTCELTLSDLLCERNRSEQARPIVKKALDQAIKLSAQDPTLLHTYLCGCAWQSVLYLQNSSWNVDEAVETARKLIEYIQENLEDLHTAATEHLCALCYKTGGKTFYLQKDFFSAESCYRKAIALYEKACSLHPSPSEQNSLAVTLLDLSDLCYDENRYQEGMELCLRAAYLLENYPSSKPLPDILMSLGSAYSRLDIFYSVLGNSSQADQYREKCRQIYTDLSDRHELPGNPINYAIALIRAGQMAMTENNYPGCLDYLHQADALLSSVEKEAENEYIALQRSIVWYRMATCYSIPDEPGYDFDTARALSLRTLHTLQAIQNKSGADVILPFQIDVLLQLASIFIAHFEGEKAIQFLQEAEQLCHTLWNQAEPESTLILKMASIQLQWGNILMNDSSPEQSVLHYQKALSLLDRLSQDTLSTDTLALRVTVRFSLSMASQCLGQVDDALETLYELIQMRTLYPNYFFTLASQEPFVQAYGTLADLYTVQEMYTRAVACYQESIRICQSICSQSAIPTGLSDLADLYLRYGTLYCLPCKMQNFEKAQGLFFLSLDALDKSIELFRRPADYWEKAQLFYLLGESFLGIEDPAEGIVWLQKSIVEMQKLRKAKIVYPDDLSDLDWLFDAFEDLINLCNDGADTAAAGDPDPEAFAIDHVNVCRQVIEEEGASFVPLCRLCRALLILFRIEMGNGNYGKTAQIRPELLQISNDILALEENEISLEYRARALCCVGMDYLETSSDSLAADYLFQAVDPFYRLTPLTEDPEILDLFAQTAQTLGTLYIELGQNENGQASLQLAGRIRNRFKTLYPDLI